jgi:hypothetical protein
MTGAEFEPAQTAQSYVSPPEVEAMLEFMSQTAEERLAWLIAVGLDEQELHVLALLGCVDSRPALTAPGRAPIRGRAVPAAQDQAGGADEGARPVARRGRPRSEQHRNSAGMRQSMDGRTHGRFRPVAAPPGQWVLPLARPADVPAPGAGRDAR